jgi:Domain of unknown function (DUF5664)
MTDAGVKHDAGKIRYDLLPMVVLRGVANVLTFGAAKYSAHAWQEVPDGLARYRSAQERHWESVVVGGENLDPESGLRHAWHYACNALFVAWFMSFRPTELAAMRDVNSPRERP